MALVTRKLVEQQQARVAEAEAKLAEERKKLAWLEGMTGDLGKALAELEVAEPLAGEAKAALPLSEPRLKPAKPREQRVLKEQEILEFVDRQRGTFTPTALQAAIESASPFDVVLRPLQVALARMARIGKGLEQTTQGNRWVESVYKRVATVRK